MSLSRQPARGGYWPAVLLALAAMVPAQINFTALGRLSPTIAQSLGVSPTDVSWLGLLGNGAYALGYLFTADLPQRLEARRLVVGFLGLLVASSLLSAAAPTDAARVDCRPHRRRLRRGRAGHRRHPPGCSRASPPAACRSP
jgi:MFS family permease